MEFLNSNLVVVLTFLIQCGVFKYMYSFIKEYRARDAARDTAIRSLLRTEIINICHKTEKDGVLPIYNLENINDMYRAYKALGGNGAIDELFHQVIQYPHNNPTGNGKGVP